MAWVCYEYKIMNLLKKNEEQGESYKRKQNKSNPKLEGKTKCNHRVDNAKEIVKEDEPLTDEISNYNLDQNLRNFTRPEVVENFLDLLRSGKISKNVEFSVFNNDHMQLASSLYQVLMFAKNWSTFYKTASWAKINVNKEIFNYAFVLAVNTRKEFKGLVVPDLEN